MAMKTHKDTIAVMETLGDMIRVEGPDPKPSYTGMDVVAGSRASATDEVVIGATPMLLIAGSPKSSICSGRCMNAGAKPA